MACHLPTRSDRKKNVLVLISVLFQQIQRCGLCSKEGWGGNTLGKTGSCSNSQLFGIDMWRGIFWRFVANACKHEISSSWKKSLCLSPNFPQQGTPLWVKFTRCEEIFSLLVLCLLNFLAISFQEWLHHDTSGKICHCLCERSRLLLFFLIIGNNFH